MKKSYPDVSGLFKMKREWRRANAQRPIEEKLRAAERLKQFSDRIPKLTPKKPTKHS